jgi:purine-nucleoside/S-methyl-5'-thioadenosine phosphorylase / adenosine deaminase
LPGHRLPDSVPTGLTVHRVRQVHGAAVVVVDGAGATVEGDGPEADAVVSPDGRACLAVLTADCAPVALGSPQGVHAAVHVGWRGLVAGVIPAAVQAMRALGATEVVAGLGPTIHPCCYAFGANDLDAVAAVAGPGVRATTAHGGPALDLPAAVRAGLEAAQAQLVVDLDHCTGCGGDAFSHRVRGDGGRQAVYVWSHPSERRR